MTVSVTHIVEDESWMDAARCRGLDPDLFFPERGESGDEAKRVCAECPVSEECLSYALRHRISHGVWSGLSERQRRKLARQPRSKPAATPKPVAPARDRPGRPPTAHGAAIRDLMADGEWRTVDEIAVVVRPTVTEGSVAWQCRQARALTTTTLHNMQRSRTAEHDNGYWRMTR